jgi:hypothetical protein
MVVNFTTNLGLAKPTDVEVAKNWAELAKLAEDNNILIAAAMSFPLTAYTPTIIATTTAPTLGTGNIRGEYQDLRGIIQGTFVVEFLDAGITAGTGEYGIKLPFPVDGAHHVVGALLTDTTGTPDCIGDGYVWDNSTVATSGTVALDAVTIAGVSYARLVTETFVGKTNRVVGSGMPFTVANLDRLTGSFCYKKA